MPLALEQLDLRGYDLVISSESGPAKGIIVPADALHVCYCHTPMRYAWDMQWDYLQETGRLSRPVVRLLLHYMRLWDAMSASRVHHFIANSAHVAKRIGAAYQRRAAVVHPPVDTAGFSVSSDQDDYYLMVGQLVRYKRAELAVEAIKRLDRRLIVVGDGPQLSELKAQQNSRIMFLGRQSDETVRHLYARCRALIFPGVEDFGIVPVEAMASGRPVIALGRGGALETVDDGVTGVLFKEQSVQSLVAAIERFERIEDQFVTERIRERALRFDRAVFKAGMQREIERLALRAGRDAVEYEPLPQMAPVPWQAFDVTSPVDASSRSVAFDVVTESPV
jgi:glycosyltransferase involved in cell wall biosynthesis